MSNPLLKNLAFMELFGASQRDDLSDEAKEAIHLEILYRMNSVVGEITSPEDLPYEELLEETFERIAAKEARERLAVVNQHIAAFDKYMRPVLEGYDA